MPHALPPRPLRLLGIVALSAALAQQAAPRPDAMVPPTHRSDVIDLVAEASARRSAPTWAGSWAASPDPARSGTEPRRLHRATVRNVMRVSIGGGAVRVRLSNTFGTAPLRVDEATVALQSDGAGIRPGSLRALRFGGARSAMIGPGARLVSDPVRMRVPAGSDVSVSLFFRGRTGPLTGHPLATATSYRAPRGNRTAATGARSYTQDSQSWLVVDGIDVRSTRAVGSVVAIGDSITDGFASTPDANRRWPDVLARRLLDQRTLRPPLGVLNAGISGNRVLSDVTEPGFFGGVNAQARLDRDVLTQTGVRTVVLAEGLNDIAAATADSTDPMSAGRLTRELVAGLQNIVRRVHAADLGIVGGTLTPYQGADFHTRRGERVRQRVNHWIRTSRAFDAVVDFDRAVRDPQRPRRILPRFDSGDHLHLNDAGYRAMGRAVRLTSLYRR